MIIHATSLALSPARCRRTAGARRQSDGGKAVQIANGRWLFSLTASAGLLLGIALAGCKPKATPYTSGSGPSTEHSANGQPTVEGVGGFLRSAAPPFARVEDVKMDTPMVMPNTSPVQHLWLCSVRFAFTPTEDLLGPAPDQDARSFQAVADELAGWTRWQEAYARSSYARLYPAPAWHAPAPFASGGQPILARLHPANQPLPPLYAKLAAEWQVDHWQFHAVDLDLPDYGEPRAAFAAPNVVLGSPETNTFLQTAQTAITQAKAIKTDVDARYRADLARAVHPGTLFKGHLTHRGSVAAVEVRGLPAASGADPQDMTLEVRLPATSGESFIYLAHLAEQVPLELAAAPAMDTSPPTSIPQALASLPQGDLRLRLVNTTGKEGVYNESVPVKLLFISRHYAQPPAVWLHLHDGHLEGRLGGYDTDPVGFVLTAQQGLTP